MSCKITIKPFPGACDIKPWPDNVPLNAQTVAEAELPLADSIAEETANSSGTELEYYSLGIYDSVTDPLYLEPVSRSFKLFRLMGVVDLPDSTPEMQEQGARTLFTTTLWIPRILVEKAGMSAPSEGDVVRFWMTPFFDDFAVDGEDIPNRGYYFDVQDVDDDGHIGDTALFTGFRLTLKRRTEFTPERRVLNE